MNQPWLSWLTFGNVGNKISEEKCKSLPPFLSSTSIHYKQKPDVSGGSTFSYQPSISDSITSTGPVGENAANQCSAVWQDSHVLFFSLSIAWKIWRGLRKRFQKSMRRGKTDKTEIYCNAPSAETEKSKLGLDSDIYSISPALSLILARKSIFVTADWARLDSRGWNESEMNEGW